MCKLVFAKNWRHDDSAKKKPYVAILTTRIDLTDEELRNAYRKRWKIEQGFRILKSWFGLISGNSSRLFETNIALVAIAQIRYALLVACKAICFPNASLNTVRKMLIKESQYQDVISDLAEGIKSVSKACKEAADKEAECIANDICDLLIDKAPELPIDDSIKKEINEVINKRINSKLQFMLRALCKALSSNTDGVTMLRNLLVRKSVILSPPNEDIKQYQALFYA